MSPLFTPFLQRQRYHAVIPYLLGDVLDLGCGVSQVAQYLQPGQGYVGVEGPQPFIQYLTSHFGQYRYFQRDLDCDPLGLENRFDTILLLAVLEHLKTPDFLLRQIPGHLKPEGRLVITTPTPLGDRIHRNGARLGLFSKEAMREHQTIFDRQSLGQILERNELEMIHYRRFLLGGNQLAIASSPFRPGR